MLTFNNTNKTHTEVLILHRRLAAVFSLGGALISFGFSINSFLREIYVLASVLFTISVFLFTSYRIISSNKHSFMQTAMRHITLLGLSLLGVFLVQSGGLNNTGPLWIFIIPPVILAFCGPLWGIIYSIIFLLVISVLLFYPGDMLLNATYSYEFKSRLLYSFITSCMLSGLYELARYKSYNELILLKDKFERESKQDELTKLSNRRYMWEILNYEQAHRTNAETFVIALLDIDHFKSVNDTYGHDIGDEVLKHISLTTECNLRPQDKLARWGGEEFLLYMPNTNETTAMFVLDGMRETIVNAPYLHGDIDISLSISIGFCNAAGATSLKDVIKFADSNLYEAKNSGRNKVIGAVI